MRDDIFAYEKVCPVCGKTFGLPHEGKWAYRIDSQHRKKTYLCSWSCQLAEESRLEVEKVKKKAGKTLITGETDVDKLREARLSAGLSQKELAARIGVVTSTVTQYENGRMSPTLQTLNKLAAALGCTAEELRRG